MNHDATALDLPGRTSPNARIREAIRRHWDRKAPTFDQGESCVSRTPLIQEAWQWIFRRTLGRRPLRVLDVGSGTGEVCFLFAGLGHRAWGVDVSPEMAGLAERKARGRSLSCRFCVGDAEALPFSDGSFDVVHARHLLWTLLRPRAALADWMRVLVPGGRILVTESAWDGAPTSPLIRARTVVGRTAAHLAARMTGAPPPVRKRSPDYPGPEMLPFHGGLGRERLLRFLDQGGLRNVCGRDLLWLRKLGRSTVPWHRRWTTSEKKGYYLAWGIRP